MFKKTDQYSVNNHVSFPYYHNYIINYSTLQDFYNNGINMVKITNTENGNVLLPLFMIY